MEDHILAHIPPQIFLLYIHISDCCFYCAVYKYFYYYYYYYYYI